MGHCTNGKHRRDIVWQVAHKFGQLDHLGGAVGEPDAPAIGWEVFGDWPLDDLQKLRRQSCKRV